MADQEAKLNREDAAGDTQPWVLVSDADNPETSLSDPVIDYGARDRLDTIAAAIGGSAVELTERMSNKRPAAGYRLWFDTADVSHIYTLEAPAAATSSTTGFRGVRVTLVAGFPVGKVEVNESATLTFDNRTTDPGWS